MRGDQLARQWRILRHIESSRNGLSVNEIAELEEVTRRTVYRDLEALQLAGFPLLNEPAEGGRKWAFVDGYKFKLPAPFTPTELMALHLYSDFTRIFEGTFFHDSLKSLHDKVRASLTQETIRFLETVQASFSVGIKPYKDYTRFREMLNHLSRTIPNRHRVEMVYHALNSEKKTVRKVDPYKVWFFDGTMYLIGHCHLRGEIRTFVLDRIEMLDVTEETFKIPDDFSLDDYLRHSFKVMRTRELYTVRIRISPEWSRWVGERVWHESQRSEKLDDGGIELTFYLAGLDEIRQWVMSLGPEATVVEPPELVNMVVRSMSDALDNYRDAGEERGGEEREAAWGRRGG
ncbi:MAG: helix-turn-helix transcriptional regulator [Desulfatibacillaceae bacterium]